MANISTPPPPQNQDIGAPLMGLYLDRPTYKVDPRGFSACNNVRIEMGRVRSDLLGWLPTAAFPSTFNQPILYQSSFVDSNNNQQIFFITPTDIIRAINGVWQYITPVYNAGTVSVTNSSATVTGVATRFNTDIQYGEPYTVLTTVSSGTKIYITTPYLAVSGISITDQANAAAILPGTYVANFGADSGGNFIILSQGIGATVTSSDVLFAGSGVTLRKNVQPGDQISFGNPTDGSLTSTWYTVTAVTSDTGLTVTPVYGGTSAANINFRVRQLLTNTINTPTPYFPEFSSTNFPAAGGFSLGPAFGQVGTGTDEWFFTNGLDPVVVFYRDGYSAFFSGTIPFKCTAILQKQGLLICGGLIESNGTRLGTSIASSDNGFPQQMSGGVSFQGFASDGPFNITRLGILGSSLMIYQTGKWGGGPDQSDDMSGAVTSASFVGFPTIWAFSNVIKTRGPVSGGAVAEFPDRHQFLAIDGEYRYNGLFIQVMNDQVWRQVLKSFDTTRPGACFATVVPTFGDLIWSIPLSTDPLGQLFASTAYVEHYMEQANSYLFKPMTQRSFPFTSAGAFSPPNALPFSSFGSFTFNQINAPFSSFGYGAAEPVYIACDFSGNIWQLYVSNTQNGIAPLCTATWGARIIGNARARSLVKRVYPEIEYNGSGGSVTVTLALQDAIAGPVTITDTQFFNPNYAGNRFTTHYRRGRVATVTFSDQAGLGWVSDGYDFDWVPGGLR